VTAIYSYKSDARKAHKKDKTAIRNRYAVTVLPDATDSVKELAQEITLTQNIPIELYDDWILRRERELNQFQAYQECPKCQKFSFAYMQERVPRRSKHLMRECGNCGHTWLQWK
jgi:DNA-directed RNA polymerase subunit M/transcription elongation factor TFIIS